MMLPAKNIRSKAYMWKENFPGVVVTKGRLILKGVSFPETIADLIEAYEFEAAG